MTGSMRNLRKRRRLKTATNETIFRNADLELEESPRISTRSIILNHDVSPHLIMRILKEEKY